MDDWDDRGDGLVSKGSTPGWAFDGVLGRKRDRESLSRSVGCGEFKASEVDDMDACANALRHT